MISKPLVAAFLAAGCVGAAAGGAYVAVRQNATERVPVAAQEVPKSEPGRPVAETEAVITPQPAPPPSAETPLEATPRPTEPEPEPKSRTIERTAQPERAPRRARTSVRSRPEDTRPAPPAIPPPAPAQNTAIPDTTAARTKRAELPGGVRPEVADPLPAPPEPQFVQVVLPASSVIGLHLETSLSTERARVEDRVDARVTRDVSAGGRVAIPAGSRAIGSVILVERGGKVKERARLGVRFHTLVFADGSELPVRTDAIFREGESPGGDSARKIGGATVGGAIIGAILGGGKGAVIGGATGAAGGTAAVMAGDRSPASLPAGTIVTVRLAEPVAIDVEKRD